MIFNFVVTPAKAGVQASERTWIPASAGMTERLLIRRPLILAFIA